MTTDPTRSSSAGRASLVAAPALATGRYNRQLLVPQLRLRGQDYLLRSRVLIIGLGGLGCPAALYLAGAGVGTLGFMDGDTVELGNLHRQIAHTESAARDGQSKVHSAAARCREINSTVKYVLHETRARPENILDVVAQYDLVLDCTDNPATRYLISDACVVLGRVLVSGAAQRGEGSLVVLNSPPVGVSGGDKGPCYRCVFPRPPPPDMVRGCSEIGVLGPVVGAIGTLLAGEAIKIVARGGHLSGSDRPLEEGKAPTPHTMLLYNTYAADPRSMFRTITLRGRRKECVACGDVAALARKGLSRITAETIALGRLDYQAFCGVMEDVKVLDEGMRVDAKDFLAGEKHGLVVDVREEHEYELGTKVDGSVNIPISKILRSGGGAFDELERLRNERAGPDLQSPISRTGPDAGMVNNKRHVPVMKGDVLGHQQGEWAQPPSLLENGVGPDAEMVNQETHIPLSDGVSSDGGMVNTESHIPVTRQKESDFPEPPQQKQQREEEEHESSSMPVYFVCQRGNDSQIAAQRLIERVGTTDGDGSTSSSRWGWIGDVKGGFLAMERFMDPTT